MKKIITTVVMTVALTVFSSILFAVDKQVIEPDSSLTKTSETSSKPISTNDTVKNKTEKPAENKSSKYSGCSADCSHNF